MIAKWFEKQNKKIYVSQNTTFIIAGNQDADCGFRSISQMDLVPGFQN